MVAHDDLSSEQWFRLCKDVYRKLRNDDEGTAVALLEDVGFSLDILNAD